MLILDILCIIHIILDSLILLYLLIHYYDEI